MSLETCKDRTGLLKESPAVEKGVHGGHRQTCALSARGNLSQAGVEGVRCKENNTKEDIPGRYLQKLVRSVENSI